MEADLAAGECPAAFDIAFDWAQARLEPVEAAMACAVELGEGVRGTTAPNPWVGAILLTADGRCFGGATEPPPGRHAEVVALDAAAAAGAEAAGGTVYCTLEPCAHHGRTGPCADALIEAGVARVFVALDDPDPQVGGKGIEALRAAGIEVRSGIGVDLAAESLGPYLHQRRNGRPWVVLKLAATLDGRIGAADASSQWITGAAARADAHRLRARCDGVLVGAGTVRVDDPSLTVRDAPGTDPRRFVLGTAPPQAKVQLCTELSGPLPQVLNALCADGVIELLVEGGAQVAGEFHRAGLVDEYVIYLAPALMGGDDGLAMIAGAGARSIEELWRGELTDVRRLGGDIRLTLRPTFASAPEPATADR